MCFRLADHRRKEQRIPSAFTRDNKMYTVKSGYRENESDVLIHSSLYTYAMATLCNLAMFWGLSPGRASSRKQRCWMVVRVVFWWGRLQVSMFQKPLLIRPLALAIFIMKGWCWFWFFPEVHAFTCMKRTLQHAMDLKKRSHALLIENEALKGLWYNLFLKAYILSTWLLTVDTFLTAVRCRVREK